MISVTVILSSHIHITWVSMTSDSQRAYQLYKTAYFIIEFHVGNSNNKFYASAIANWLSSCMTEAPHGSPFSSVSECLSHITSCVALESAMYSASVVQSATDVCFLLFQLVGAPRNLNRYPEVDFRCHSLGITITSTTRQLPLLM